MRWKPGTSRSTRPRLRGQTSPTAASSNRGWGRNSRSSPCWSISHAARASSSTLNKELNSMKLLRYGPLGEERPGIVDATGALRSLWPAVQDLTPDVISPEGLKVLAAIDPDLEPFGRNDVRGQVL